MAALLELLDPWVASQTLRMPKVMALKTLLFLRRWRFYVILQVDVEVSIVMGVPQMDGLFHGTSH